MSNLKYIFVLVLITAILSPAMAADRLPGPYRAQVLDVLDGDTFRARVTIWLGQEAEILVRIGGIDAPEHRGKCPAEHDKAIEAQKHLTQLIGDGAVMLHDIHYGKYAGRVIARVTNADTGKDIATAMRSTNIVSPYAGEKAARKQWC